MSNIWKRIFFSILWIFFFILFIALHAINVNWSALLSGTDTGTQIFHLLILALIQFACAEQCIFLLAAILVGRRFKHYYEDAVDLDDPEAPPLRSEPLVIMCYILRAESQQEINLAFENMFLSFTQNMFPSCACALVTCTLDDTLRRHEIRKRDEFREKMHQLLVDEGENFVRGKFSLLDKRRLRHFWLPLAETHSFDNIQSHLHRICDRFTMDFLLLQQSSDYLNECGSYQDLILLSSGENSAFSYTDSRFYKVWARNHGQQLFLQAPDVRRVYGRHFDYTLILRSDTICPRGMVRKLVMFAHKYHHYSIFQLSARIEKRFPLHKIGRVRLHHLQKCQQNALCHVNVSGQFLVRNTDYIKALIGNPIDLLEVVPLDCLRTSTVESAYLNTCYVSRFKVDHYDESNGVTFFQKRKKEVMSEIFNLSTLLPSCCGVLRATLSRCCKKVLSSPHYRCKCHVFNFWRRAIALRRVAKFLCHFTTFVYIVFYSFMPVAQMTYRWMGVLEIYLCFVIIPMLCCFTRGRVYIFPIDLLVRTIFIWGDIVLDFILVIIALACFACPATALSTKTSTEVLNTVNGSIKSLCMHTMYYYWLISLIGVLLFILHLGLGLLEFIVLRPESLLIFCTLIFYPLYAFCTGLGGGVSHKKKPVDELDASNEYYMNNGDISDDLPASSRLHSSSKSRGEQLYEQADKFNLHGTGSSQLSLSISSMSDGSANSPRNVPTVLELPSFKGSNSSFEFRGSNPSVS